jgi:hypothetical protein
MASESSQSLSEGELRQLKGRLNELRQTEANFLERCKMTFIILVAIQMQFETSMGNEQATLSDWVKDDKSLIKNLHLLAKQLQTIQGPLNLLPAVAKEAIAIVVNQLKEFRGYNFFEALIPPEETLAALNANETIDILVELNTRLNDKKTVTRFCRNLLSCAVLLIYEDNVYAHLSGELIKAEIEKGASYFSKAGLQLLLHQGLLRLIELRNFSTEFEKIFNTKAPIHPGRLAADSISRKMDRVNRYANELKRDPEKLKDKQFLENSLANLLSDIIDTMAAYSIDPSFLSTTISASTDDDIVQDEYSKFMNLLTPMNAFTLLSEIPNATLPSQHLVKQVLEHADGYFIRTSPSGSLHHAASENEAQQELALYFNFCAHIRRGQKESFRWIISDAFDKAQTPTPIFSGPEQHLQRLEEGSWRLQLFRQQLIKNFINYLTPDNPLINSIINSINKKITELTNDNAAFTTTKTSQKLLHLTALKNLLELCKKDSHAEILSKIEIWEQRKIDIDGEVITIRNLMEIKRARPFRFTSSEPIIDIIDRIKESLSNPALEASTTYESIQFEEPPKKSFFYACGSSR